MLFIAYNICTSYEEMSRRLNIDGLTYYEIFEKLDESIIKILSQREQGFRICHPLIARKILEHVYEENEENKIYSATIDFVNRINDIYGSEENVYVDKIFRELFIDRSYIDGEKQYFSEIIAAIPKQSLKKKVFQHLISLYPENPHYYNHLGRLEAFDAYKDSGYFEPAIVNLYKAIKIAENQGLDLTSHYTTLACIYSRKVVNYISSLKWDRKQISIERIFDNIRCDFGNATDYFLMARNKNYNNTYGYFPNILMICNVINYIVAYTKKDVNLLLEDVFFKEWYDYNVGIAVQLYTAMENNCEDEILSNLSSRAQTAIDKISGNIAALKEKLNRLEKRGFGSKEMGNIRRTITSMLYIKNQYSWENMDMENLQYAKDAMYDNMVSGNYTEVDVINWFNLYRRTEEFDTHKAVEVIEEYMKNGYYNTVIQLHDFFEIGDVASAADLPHAGQARLYCQSSLVVYLVFFVLVNCWRSGTSKCQARNKKRSKLLKNSKKQQLSSKKQQKKNSRSQKFLILSVNFNFCFQNPHIYSKVVPIILCYPGVFCFIFSKI